MGPKVARRIAFHLAVGRKKARQAFRTRMVANRQARQATKYLSKGRVLAAVARPKLSRLFR
jgi:hypothetical protein